MTETLRYLTCLSFSIFFFITSVSAVEPPHSFLSEEAKKIIKDSTYIYADNLEAMIITPELLPPDRYDLDSKILNSDQVNSLKKYIEAAHDINLIERSKDCVFQPGISFVIANEAPGKGTKARLKDLLDENSKSIQILLCFNCDLWAIGNINEINSSNSLHKKQIIAYGDSRPHRKELLKLMREIFKSDKPWVALPEN